MTTNKMLLLNNKIYQFGINQIKTWPAAAHDAL